MITGRGAGPRPAASRLVSTLVRGGCQFKGGIETRNQRGWALMGAGNSSENSGSEDAASYGRAHTGAFLPVDEYGSGPDDHEIGGSHFARSGSTPMEEFELNRDGRASLNLWRKADDANGEQHSRRIKRGSGSHASRGKTWAADLVRRPGLDVVHRDAVALTSEVERLRSGGTGSEQRTRAGIRVLHDGLAPNGGMAERVWHQNRGDAVDGGVLDSGIRVLEQYGFEVWLVNARDTRNLPGRKSDVQESQWLVEAAQRMEC